MNNSPSNMMLIYTQIPMLAERKFYDRKRFERTYLNHLLAALSACNIPS